MYVTDCLSDNTSLSPDWLNSATCTSCSRSVGKAGMAAPCARLKELILPSLHLKSALNVFRPGSYNHSFAHGVRLRPDDFDNAPMKSSRVALRYENSVR